MIEPAMAEDCNNPSIQRLVDEHAEAVYRYEYRLPGTVQDAEDLAQQWFLLAQQRLDQFRHSDRARGWLFTTLRNLFLKTVDRAGPVAATNLGLDLEIFFFQAEDGIRDLYVTGVQTCALPI